MGSSGQRFHVLVIGAGSTGLLIGQGLKRAGISARVYERVDTDTYQYRQRDWSMALHWGSDFLSTCLPPELLAGLKNAQPDPWVELTEDQERFMPVYNGKTGEEVLKAPAATSRRISREKLRKLASDGLDIRYGSKLVGMEDDGKKITAHFEDGHVATGDVLIGCDSAGSYVRTYLLGPEKAACESVPVITWNFTCRYTAEQAIYIRNSLHPLQKNAVHPDQNTWYVLPMMNIDDPEDPTTWTFQHLLNLWVDHGEETPRDPRERLAHFKAVAANYCEPWYSASQWVKDDTFIPYDRLKHWPNPVRWDNHGGRVTLAGDAAHPMVPFRGQGLNNALQDAALYVQTITRILATPETERTSTLRDLVNRYDEEVFIRGSQEIALSADQMYRSMHFNEFMSSPLAKHGLNKTK